MFYYEGGVRCQHEITPSFTFGLNLKILRSTDVDKRYEHSYGNGRIKRRVQGENMWGGEIGVPLIWHVGSAKRWDIQLEPYFFTLDFSGVQNMYGTRLLFGYRF
jgi:hypothetical protein